MSVTATPTLTAAGQSVAGTLAGDPSLVAVDELQLTWGRAGVLATPTPAVVNLTVLDKSAGATFARREDLIGQPIVVGWSCSDGSTGTSFRGRITDAQATPRRSGGFLVALAASSVEVDLANHKAPEGTVFPAETMQARLTRILALLPSVPGQPNFPALLPAQTASTGSGSPAQLPEYTDLGLSSSYGGLPLNALTAAQQEAGGQDVLALLRQLYASCGPLPMVYDPAAQGLRFASRRRHVLSTSRGFTMSAQLVASPDHGGRYVAAGLTGLHLDAQLTEYAGALGQTLDSRITRVEVNYLDENAAYETRTATAATVDTPNEATIGRRTLTVDTVLAAGSAAANLAGFYADLVSREARTRRLGPLGFTTRREPFHDAAHVTALLSGRELTPALFLGRSWLPRLGASPLVGVLGATVVYAGGEWSVQLTPAPTVVDPSPGMWGPLTIAAAGTPAVRLRDVDRSVTIADAGFLDVGAGFTPANAQPYGGNHG